MTNKTMLKASLNKRPDLQQYLFCRGFLITDRDLDTKPYPFYGNWNIINSKLPFYK